MFAVWAAPRTDSNIEASEIANSSEFSYVTHSRLEFRHPHYIRVNWKKWTTSDFQLAALLSAIVVCPWNSTITINSQELISIYLFARLSSRIVMGARFSEKLFTLMCRWRKKTQHTFSRFLGKTLAVDVGLRRAQRSSVNFFCVFFLMKWEISTDIYLIKFNFTPTNSPFSELQISRSETFVFTWLLIIRCLVLRSWYFQYKLYFVQPLCLVISRFII